jgi:capsular polysaccharide transport system permease protein
VTVKDDESRTKLASPLGGLGGFMARASGRSLRAPAARDVVHPEPEAADIPAATGAPLAATRARPPWGPVSFLLTVVAPALACLLYLVLVATPQYVSESRFVVRGSLERLGIESVGQAAMLSSLNNSQEAHIVADYIRSPKIVTDLAGKFDLERLFSNSPLDVLWHLPAGASPDRLTRYWQRMVNVEVDPLSGIVSLRVHAFKPEDAKALNEEILRLGEALVSAFTQRMRSQHLEETLADSKAAQAEMTTLLSALETERGRAETLDPLETASTLAALVSTLRDERATLMAAQDAAASRLKGDAPTLALANERIRALDTQIDLVLATATQARPGARATADLLKDASLFDFLQTRRELVMRRVARAEAALAQARQEAIRQQVFIDVFMKPTLGETMAYPQPLLTTLIVFLGLLAIWSIAALYAGTVRERMR